MLIIKKFVFSVFQVNTFLLYDSETRKGAVIDPGCSNKSEEETLSEIIVNEKIDLEFIINTHLHIDHIFGNAFLKNKFGAKIVYPRTDEFLLPIMLNEAKTYGVTLTPSPQADIFFEEIENIKIGNFVFKPLFTPGHTPGEYCLFCETEKVCFTGDVLFKESIGRTDLWQGDYDLLIDSIYDKLFTLDDDVTVYPGHGPLTTIAHEKNFNPFL